MGKDNHEDRNEREKREKGEGDTDSPEKNLMKIKMYQEKHDMSDPNHRMIFYLSILKELGALKKKGPKLPESSKTQNTENLSEKNTNTTHN